MDTMDDALVWLTIYFGGQKCAGKYILELNLSPVVPSTDYTPLGMKEGEY